MNLLSEIVGTLTQMSQAFWSSVKENGLEQLVLAIAALVGLLILAALVGFTKKGKAVTPGKRGADITKFKDVAYLPLRIMTQVEEDFWKLLVQATPGCQVFPKVGGSALVIAQSDNAGHFWEATNRFNKNRFDFVVCNNQLKVIALVELDDQSQEQRLEQDKEQDFITSQAGYRTIRFDSRNWPSVNQIRMGIFA